MSFKEEFHAALVKYINEYEYEYPRTQVVDVLGYEDKTIPGGYCETCYYEQAVVDVEVIYDNGERDTFRIYEDFGYLIKYLTK